MLASEVDNNCVEEQEIACNTGRDTSDAICECLAVAPPSPPPSPPAPPSSPDQCDEATWPDTDHGLVCADCLVLVDDFDTKYGNCNTYCASVERTCTGAWEESGDSCRVKYDMTCDQSIDSSDALCECGAPGLPISPPVPPSPPPPSPSPP